jgi:hypothetical protein
VENCFGTINTCLLWISLTTVTPCADCYCGTLSLRQPFFCKRPRLLHMQMPGVMHPTGLTVVYGCTSAMLWISPNLMLSVLSLTEPWESPGWQVIAIDADVKQVITSWLQTLDSSVFTLVPLWGKCCDGNGDYVAVWCVPSAAHVPCIDGSHDNIRTWEWLLPYFVKVLYIYIAVWAGEFINTVCSEWWSFCVICW